MIRVLALCAVAACARIDAAPPGPLDATTVVCDRAVRCGTIAPAQRAECLRGPGRSRLELVWGTASPPLVSDPAADQTCLAQLVHAGCREPTPACGASTGHAPAPNLVPGAACTRSDQCKAGYCTAQPGCRGTCVAYAALGAACDQNQLCGDGLFCASGTCRARASQGAECRGHWQWCADGLICDGYRPASSAGPHETPETPGTCIRPKGPGESCVPTSALAAELCRHDLFCDWGSAAPTCRVRLAAGATCTWLDACADGLACTGLVLHGAGIAHHYGVAHAGTCTAIKDAGAACDPSAFVSGCAASMRCDRVARTCRSTGHAGDACESSWVTGPVPDDAPLDRPGCFSGLACDPATHRCRPQLAVGAACTPTRVGVDDDPCFLGRCDPGTRRCVAACTSK